MFNDIGKNTGVEAVKELHATADDALDKVSHEVIPELGRTVESATDHATFSLAGVIADIANRLSGAELPVDITVTATATVIIKGKIGALKLSNPECDSTVLPSATVGE